MKDVLYEIGIITKEMMFKDLHFYSFFLSGIDKVIAYSGTPLAESVKSAQVSKNNNFGFTLSVNEDFWWKMKAIGKKEGYDLVTDVLIHEALHIAYLHPVTFSGQNIQYRDILNIALDLEVNQSCREVTRYAKNNPFDYFELKEILQNLSPIERAEFIKNSKPTFMTIDIFNWGDKPNLGGREYYKMLLDLADRTRNNQNLPNDRKDLGQMLIDMMENQDIADQISQMLGHNCWDNEPMSSIEVEIINNKMYNYLKEVVNNIQLHKNIGNIPLGIEEFMNSLIKDKEPVLDWKQTLRRLTQKVVERYTKLSSRKLNKRNPDFKAVKIKQLTRILFVIDTSGSMSDEDIKESFEELENIRKAQNAVIDVLECDSIIYEDKIYTLNNFKRTKPQSVTGRGGTKVDPAIHYVNKNLNKYSAMIYFTDGYVPEPMVKCSIPLITIICKNGFKDIEKMSSKFGYIIKTD